MESYSRVARLGKSFQKKNRVQGLGFRVEGLGLRVAEKGSYL